MALVDVTLSPQLMLAISYVVLLAPAPLLALAWIQTRRSPRVKVANTVLGFLVASWFYLMIGLFVRNVIGPDYSHQRFIVLGSMLVLSVSACVTGLFIGRPGCGWAVSAAASVSLAWFQTAIVSAVV